MSVEDKEALKAGAGACCVKFTNFVDKFSEMIFIVTLLGAAGFKIFWTFFSGDVAMQNFTVLSAMVITSVLMVVAAGIIW